MSFADLEARTNASVYKALANALAVYTPAVGQPTEFPVVFDPASGFVDEFGAVTQMPRLTMQPVAFSTLEEGMALALRKSNVAQTALGNYTVRSVVPLDEGGWQRVTLARAA